MKDANIPTANFWKVNCRRSKNHFLIIYSTCSKGDGLASGKGVFIPESKDECFKAAKMILNGKFGNSGNVVVLEEKIQGPEVSVLYVMERDTYFFPAHKITSVSKKRTKGQILEEWGHILLLHF